MNELINVAFITGHRYWCIFFSSSVYSSIIIILRGIFYFF